MSVMHANEVPTSTYNALFDQVHQVHRCWEPRHFLGGDECLDLVEDIHVLLLNDIFCLNDRFQGIDHTESQVSPCRFESIVM